MPVIDGAGRGRSFGAVMMAAVAVTSLAGCTGADAAGESGLKDQDAWKMPLDEFYVYSVELDNYAEQLLTSKCLEQRGYEWPVPWQNTDYPQPKDFNRVGIRLFTLELATEYGYQFAPPADVESARLWVEFIETAEAYFPDSELDEELVNCRDEIRAVDEDSNQSFDGVNEIMGLALQADQVALQSPAVMEATERWRECLQPQVDFTLPEEPRTEMPPHGADADWVSVDGHPSVDEIAVAVADAECRESSGLSAAAYETEWEEQRKLVDLNRDKLERIRDDAQDRKAYLLTIVADNAPPAP